MWVWQSQAPAGMSKFTGVAGCAAFARAVRWGMVTPAAMGARRIWRLVSIAFSPLWAFVFLILRFGTPAAAYQVRVEASDRPRQTIKAQCPKAQSPKAQCPKACETGQAGSRSVDCCWFVT